LGRLGEGCSNGCSNFRHKTLMAAFAKPLLAAVRSKL
jgi:hypothetical protein